VAHSAVGAAANAGVRWAWGRACPYPINLLLIHHCGRHRTGSFAGHNQSASAPSTGATQSASAPSTV